MGFRMLFTVFDMMWYPVSIGFMIVFKRVLCQLNKLVDPFNACKV